MHLRPRQLFLAMAPAWQGGTWGPQWFAFPSLCAFTIWGLVSIKRPSNFGRSNFAHVNSMRSSRENRENHEFFWERKSKEDEPHIAMSRCNVRIKLFIVWASRVSGPERLPCLRRAQLLGTMRDALTVQGGWNNVNLIRQVWTLFGRNWCKEKSNMCGVWS